MRKGDVVRSTHGHDKGGIFVVLDVEDDYLHLADGRKRRIEKPKRKKCKHVQKIAAEAIALPMERLSNKAVWQALRQYREG
ncbi:MAG: KOW domain-containing RNA-binding protein [Oscillospiraceae bacterium]|nr:KOW domain-containing RNA-binding protein [Oscillospiraceae bacterium]